jgi:hypothetical protein
MMHHRIPSQEISSRPHAKDKHGWAASIALQEIHGCMLLTVNSCIKVRLDLQADKSPVIVKGPFFPRVVNPRYQIRETNV